MPTIAVTDSPRPAPPRPPRSPRQWLLIGCGLAAVCLLAAGVAGAAGWVFFRPKPAAAEPTVEYILDASPRMGLPTEGGTRLTQARAALAEIVRPAARTVTAGLRVFGNGTLPEPCRDTQLLVPLAPANQGKIADSLVTVEAGAKADAAVAESMVSAIRDLTSTAGPHTLVVVTGGADSCNPEAGQLLAQEADKAGIKLEFFVIGFQVPSDEAEAIKSMVDDTPGATYLEAVDTTSLRLILESIQRHVDNPSAVSAENVIATARAALPTAPAPAALDEAAQIVLNQVVHPDTLDHETIVFHWPDPIGPADTLETLPDASLPAPPTPPTPVKPSKESWFFWVDDFPAGKFAHPSRFVLVDRVTRAVTVLDTHWWPVLNGAALWVKPSDYWNPANWSFSNFKGRPLDLGGASRFGPGLARALALRPVLQDGGKAVALVANGWQPDQPGEEALAQDGAAMQEAFIHAGLLTDYLSNTSDGTASGPYSPEAVLSWFSTQAGELGAGDVLAFYLTGHGSGGDEPAVLAGLSVDQLSAALRALDPAVHVIVVLDGSYAGSFITPLSPYADRIITATDARLPALFDDDSPNDPNAQVDRGSEFTSGFAAGWEAIMNDAAQRDAAAQKAQAEGRPLADVLAEMAFHSAVAVDAGAISGRTRPQMVPEHQPEATATPIPSPTETPTPTSTPRPTLTRTRVPPTFTPTPTFTPVPPTPTPTFTRVPQPFLNFSADATTLNAGQCTNLRWDSGDIQDLHLDNDGVVGSGSRDVCPTGTTTYTLVANSVAGQLVRQVTITVNPPPPLVIVGATQSDRIFYDVAGCGPTEVLIRATVQNATAVTLFYRVVTTAAAPPPYSQLPFVHEEGDSWAVVLHGSDMSGFGGVEYFVAAENQFTKAQSQVFRGPVYAHCQPIG